MIVLDEIDKCINSVGSRVHSIRKSRGMSLQDVADLSQMSKTHIWDIEQGKSPNMTVRTILKISFALKTTPSNLLQFDFVDSTLTDQEVQIALAAREIYRNPLQTTP